MDATTPQQPHWRGINHLALVTDDMDATVRFYHGVLGARLVATIGTPTFRHYFFEFGEEQTLAFFEYRGKLMPISASSCPMCTISVAFVPKMWTPSTRRSSVDTNSLSMP